jgi:ABC-2 type transport system permease protein
LSSLLGVVIDDERWHRRLERCAPMNAGLAVQATRRLDDLTIGAWTGLAVVLAYGAVAWAAGAGVLTTRDA